MAKICKLTDTHFGVKGFSEVFDNHFRTFYTKTLFPYLDKHGIKIIVLLGDSFDVRKNVNLEALYNCKQYFFDECAKRGIELIMIIGNHDAHFKDTLKVNTPDLVLREYKNITIIDEPKDVTIDGTSILMMPWICSDNVEKSMAMLDTSKSKYCFGHFEIAGFRMHKNTESHGGFEPVTFNRFKKVFSGHYHTRSTKGNITYLGTNTEMSWNDYNDTKGFHIFDTNTGESEFIENPDKLFYIINYDDDYVAEPIDLKGKIVRVITKNIQNQTKYDKFIKSLQDTNPSELKAVDQDTILAVEDSDEDIVVDDTLSVLKCYVDSVSDSLIENKLNPDVLKALLTDVHREAIEK